MEIVGYKVFHKGVGWNYAFFSAFLIRHDYNDNTISDL